MIDVETSGSVRAGAEFAGRRELKRAFALQLRRRVTPLILGRQSGLDGIDLQRCRRRRAIGAAGVVGNV
jgi:hypothetical protein